jgi:hypothetical protein
MAFGDFTVTRASTKLRIGSNGLYGSVANNVPAFEFNTDGSYRGLLVEPGATNLLERSQEFENAYWSKVGTASVTPNTEVSPDGTTTADTLSGATGDTATTSTNTLERIATVASSQTYTYSIFLKSAGATTCKITARDASTGNTTNLTVSLTSSWQRVSVVRATGGTTTQMNIRVGGSDGDIFIWQAQLETGAVATSPIVTTAGTASRVADAVFLTGASSLIGQTAGVLYAEFETRNTGVAGRLFCIDEDANDNRIILLRNSNNTFSFLVTNGGASQTSISTSANLMGIQKMAAAYAVNDFALYLNGTSIGTNTLGTVPAVSRIGIGVNGGGGSAVLNGWIRSVALFPTRLANATLAVLTQ